MQKISFGTGGFRGVIGDEFTKDNLCKICQAISDIIKEENLIKEVVIGYDNRFMSDEFAKWSAEVFLGNGIKVNLTSESVPTPIVMYQMKEKALDYSICITASHNPYKFNGVKVFYKGADASEEITSIIEAKCNNLDINEVLFKNLDLAKNDSELKEIDCKCDYLKSIYKNIDLNHIKKSNLKIAFDNMFGSTLNCIKQFIRDCSFKESEILHCERDAFFGFAMPAPTPNSIFPLSSTVVNNGYDIGFAVDGDGDRLAVVDKNGEYIDNNFLMAMLYYYFLKYKKLKGDIVKNIATLDILDIIAEKLGCKCHEVNVGFKNISSKMKEVNALLGGESSGGLAMLTHIMGKDSMFAICLIIDMVCALNKSIDEILKETKEFANNYQNTLYEKQYGYSKQRKDEIMKLLFEDKIMPIFNKEIENIIIEKYVKVRFKDGTWVIVRFSGTEPIIRIMAEISQNDNPEDFITPWLELLKIDI